MGKHQSVSLGSTISPDDQGGWPDSEECRLILCPVCDFNYSHPGEPTLTASDDYTADWFGRGNLIVVPFRGECGHSWEICFGNHKGETVIFARSGPSVIGEHDGLNFVRAVMLAPDLMQKLQIDRLDFADPRHRVIWQYMEASTHHRGEVCMEGLMEGLIRHGCLEEAGGRQYVEAVTGFESDPSSEPPSVVRESDGPALSPRGPRPIKIVAAANWLRGHLGDGPRSLPSIRKAAAEAEPPGPHSVGTLYEAKARFDDLFPGLRLEEGDTPGSESRSWWIETVGPAEPSPPCTCEPSPERDIAKAFARLPEPFFLVDEKSQARTVYMAVPAGPHAETAQSKSIIEFLNAVEQTAAHLPVRELNRMIRIMRNWKRAEGKAPR